MYYNNFGYNFGVYICMLEIRIDCVLIGFMVFEYYVG